MPWNLTRHSSSSGFAPWLIYSATLPLPTGVLALAAASAGARRLRLNPSARALLVDWRGADPATAASAGGDRLLLQLAEILYECDDEQVVLEKAAVNLREWEPTVLVVSAGTFSPTDGGAVGSAYESSAGGWSADDLQLLRRAVRPVRPARPVLS